MLICPIPHQINTTLTAEARKKKIERILRLAFDQELINGMDYVWLQGMITSDGFLVTTKHWWDVLSKVKTPKVQG